MTLNIQEVARAVGADAPPAPLAVAGWSVDTRTQNPGDVYFALRGPNHDGHDFLTTAIEKGAAALVVERAGAAVGKPLPDGRGSDQSHDRKGAVRESAANSSSPIPNAPSKTLPHGRAKNGLGE